MAWLMVLGLLNSVAIVTVAITLRRHHKREECDRKSLRANVSHYREEVIRTQNNTRELQKEIRELREENTWIRKREPIKDREFIFDGESAMILAADKHVNEEFLDYIARVALKVILSELPEEIRTKKAVEIITEKISSASDESKIEL